MILCSMSFKLFYGPVENGLVSDILDYIRPLHSSLLAERFVSIECTRFPPAQIVLDLRRCCCCCLAGLGISSKQVQTGFVRLRGVQINWLAGWLTAPSLWSERKKCPAQIIEYVMQFFPLNKFLLSFCLFVPSFFLSEQHASKGK